MTPIETGPSPRAEAAPGVLVVQTVSAPHKPRRRPGRRPGREAEPPEALPLTRFTVVRAERPFSDESEATRWMRETVKDSEALEAALAEACRVINRALHALAASDQDPYVPQLSPAKAVAARIGHGEGPELAEGNFTEALPVPTARPERRRHVRIERQERVAAILSGRERAAVCETFVLRARADLDAGRIREGVFCLATAVENMVLELNGDLKDPAHEAELARLAGARGELEGLVASARRGIPSRAESERAEELLTLCERVLRRRRLMRG